MWPMGRNVIGLILVWLDVGSLAFLWVVLDVSSLLLRKKSNDQFCSPTKLLWLGDTVGFSKAWGHCAVVCGCRMKSCEGSFWCHVDLLNCKKIAVITSPGFKGHKLVIAALISSFIFAHINAACALLMNVRSGPAERETASGSLQTPTHVQNSQEELQQLTRAALNSQCCAVSDVMLQIVLTGGIICAHPRRNSWVWGNNCALGCDGGLNVRCAHELLCLFAARHSGVNTGVSDTHNTRRARF